jgi:uncharacterized membrane protein YeaQ/YmgE (transglycosylase-associated protein family)
VVGEIIGAIVLGLIAGYVAKALLPGDDPGGFVATILLGIAGSLIGYFIFTGLLGIGDDDKFDFGGIIHQRHDDAAARVPLVQGANGSDRILPGGGSAGEPHPGLPTRPSPSDALGAQ